MKIPEFTAQASLYMSSNRYRSSCAECDGSLPAQSVVAAYLPGPETMKTCEGCVGGCAAKRNICFLKAGVFAFESCLEAGPFFPICLIEEAASLVAGCYEGYSICFGDCHIPFDTPFSGGCCPKICGVHTLGIAGSGCCDFDETCVGAGQANTRDGCCPAGQDCGGNCCAPGETCSSDGTCAPPPPMFGNAPPPRPPPHTCSPGAAPCGLPDSGGAVRTCCPPGLRCCSYSAQFGPDCRTSCLH
jgi:hypothetical protein